MEKGGKHILIVNQHGENRGDEAAMRAMLDALNGMIPNAQFTLLCQFRDRDLQLDFKEDVQILPIILWFHEALGLAVFVALKSIGIEFPFLLVGKTRQIVNAYVKSHLVLSAPGGPYFGDIYYRHEIVHWFFIYMALLYKKPLCLYAPSVGPFRIPLLNSVRKYFFKQFRILCVREAISRNHLHTLLGDETDIYVTADSALQREFRAMDRREYFRDGKSILSEHFLVSVSAIQYSYPGLQNARELQDQYEKTIVECLAHLGKRKKCHFLFFPQLYGNVHSDVPFLKQLGSQLPQDLSWEIVDDELDSDMQQRIFAMSDFCIASRYHPQIFAASAGVPGICIYYEHKAYGFMEMIGMQHFAFDIRSLESESICRTLDEALQRRAELSTILKERVQLLREKARKTTLLAVNLLNDPSESADIAF